MSADEARERAETNPHSFVWISRPEVAASQKAGPLTADLLLAARRRLLDWLQNLKFIHEPKPVYYVLKQSDRYGSRTGWIGLASCQAYEKGLIKPHEKTRPDKENERYEHIKVLEAQTGLVMLFHRPDPTLSSLAELIQTTDLVLDFVADDGVRQQVWVVDDSEAISLIQQRFQLIDALYIADGHHRAAAAVRLWKDSARAEHLSGFLAAAFPAHQMYVFPYHRVLKDVPQSELDGLVDRLSSDFEPIEPPQPEPSDPQCFSVLLPKGWFTFRANFSKLQTPQTKTLLIHELLQHQILRPLFGILDPRSDKRLDFIGGPNALCQIEGGVRQGQYACAFTLPPVPVSVLMQLADAGQLLPPKSTWFHPKLPDGIFIYSWIGLPI